LSGDEMLAWQILADAKWRELRWLDLSLQGVGWSDWRGVGEFAERCMSMRSRPAAIFANVDHGP